MNRRSPRAGSLALAGLFALALCSLPAAAPAQTDDLIGLWFGAPASGVNEGTAGTFPHFDTGYLVLESPTLPDIGGWELRLATEGPVTVVGWQLTGQAVNFESPPQFVVGLGSPLPADAQVVLASCEFMLSEDAPVTFALHPVYTPSLPGEMSYIPYSQDKEPLTPLRTVTGLPDVAWYNASTPVCDVGATSLAWDGVPTGIVATRWVTVANVGGGVLGFTPQVLGDAPFTLVSPGTRNVAAGQQVAVGVQFASGTVGEFSGTLDLGTGCGTVHLWARAREPVVSVRPYPESMDFGDVVVGESRSRTVRVTNDGEVAVVVDPVLPDSCAAFALLTSGPDTLAPGAHVDVGARFAPASVGFAGCSLVLGDGLPTVPMSGVGMDVTSPHIVLTPTSVDFGDVAVGNSVRRDVTVSNDGTDMAQFQIGLPASCSDFSVEPAGTHSLAAGSWMNVRVRFTPTATGPSSCTVSLGEGMPTIPLAGSGVDDDGVVRLQPTLVDFGGVAVGSWTERTVTVINETFGTVELAPDAGDPATGFSLTGSPASIVLSPGARHTLTLKFQPVVLGLHEGTLAFGEGLPTAALRGTGETPTEGWLVEPTSIDFGNFSVTAAFTDRDVLITNLGNQQQTLTIDLEEDILGPYNMLYGGQVTIFPGRTHRVLIRFSPEVPGVYDAELLVDDIATIPITGTGVTDAPRCFVHAGSLEFGTVLTGATAVASTYVTNTGNTALDLDPRAQCDDFLYAGGPFRLDSGQTVELDVAFNPTSAGEQICVLDLGESLCAKVVLYGEGSDSLVPDHDLVGVWFDEDLTTGIRDDLAVGEAVPAWLAMLNPSRPEGIGGWELRLDLGDGLELTGHALAGQAFNIETAPEFFVGLGTPLPWAPEIVLATFEFTVTDTELHAVDLVPLWQPSIPDGLAYVYGEEFQLAEMHPVSGVPSVAWLSAAAPVAVTAPAPAAVLADGRVELRWPVPSDGADGCHVYRAVGGDETRLTAVPLRPRAGGYLYVDDPADLPAGASVAYSYGVLRGGAEIARSPAASVQLPGAGVLATRLLPNRPNPFNPETEIRFELRRAGSVRLGVYDVAGRRVAVLADGVRAAGGHHVTWRGRDDAGRLLPSGAYYVRLETAEGRDTRKVMLLK